MARDRNLEWEGCYNVRDLGGFRTREGQTRSGAIVRADGLNRLTKSGWLALENYGIRTVVDLRNDDELDSDEVLRPDLVTTVNVPLDDIEDVELWEHIRDNQLDGSPLYYSLFLGRKPHRCVAVLKAIAHAQPGGVVFHCGLGRDRTGLVALLVLALAGVGVDDIATDYDLSTDRVRQLGAVRNEPDQGAEIAKILAHKKTSARLLIHQLMETLDVEGALGPAGLQAHDLDALRRRFVETRTAQTSG